MHYYTVLQKEGPTMQKGDKVHYIPHLIHALERDRNGDYPWAIGRKELVHRTVGGRVQMEEKVIELRGSELDNFLDAVRRHPNPSEEMKKVAFIRPLKHWPAIIRQVNEDGTVNLDIETINGGILHYDNVPVGEVHHSCKEVEHGGS